ncbi:MAG TPA: SRPBCC domain-containing protein, partial [Polyangiales bacterium]|nr:SRPBCC domain-containing protein [Polyangiales bacterium]
NDGKQEFGFHGEYKEVSAPSKLVNSEFYDAGNVGGDMGKGALITVEFIENKGVTTMVSTMDFGTKEARDAAVATGMTDGMEQSYQLLDKVLANR